MTHAAARPRVIAPEALVMGYIQVDHGYLSRFAESRESIAWVASINRVLLGTVFVDVGTVPVAQRRGLQTLLSAVGQLRPIGVVVASLTHLSMDPRERDRLIAEFHRRGCLVISPRKQAVRLLARAIQ